MNETKGKWKTRKNKRSFPFVYPTLLVIIVHLSSVLLLNVKEWKGLMGMEGMDRKGREHQGSNNVWE